MYNIILVYSLVVAPYHYPVLNLTEAQVHPGNTMEDTYMYIPPNNILALHNTLYTWNLHFVEEKCSPCGSCEALNNDKYIVCYT